MKTELEITGKTVSEEVLLYNIDKKEKQMLKNIFNDLKINTSYREITDEEEILAYLSLFCFIRMPQDEEKTKQIREVLGFVKGFIVVFIVDNNFFLNSDKIKNSIKEFYEESKQLKVMYNCTPDFIKDGVIGFAIGDALGVPAEFKTREQLRCNPITDMTGYGTYPIPKGSWSDDTSMTLATMDSIIQNNEISTNDIANNFLKWFRKGEYTANGERFDIGRTTSQALAKFELNIDNAENCGQDGKMDNGNGSLMRMLPIAYYIWFCNYNNNEDMSEEKIYNIVKSVSSITHRHEISIMGCYILVQYTLGIMCGEYKELVYHNIKELDYSFFSSETIKEYNVILEGNIKDEVI